MSSMQCLLGAELWQSFHSRQQPTSTITSTSPRCRLRTIPARVDIAVCNSAIHTTCSSIAPCASSRPAAWQLGRSTVSPVSGRLENIKILNCGQFLRVCSDESPHSRNGSGRVRLACLGSILSCLAFGQVGLGGSARFRSHALTVCHAAEGAGKHCQKLTKYE